MFSFLSSNATFSIVFRKTASFLLAVFLLLSSVGPAFAQKASSTPSGTPPENVNSGGSDSLEFMGGSDGHLDNSRHMYNTGNYTDVDQLSGSFLFQVPIVIPPGRNGVQPKIVLQYSSQPQTETSVVGYGWDLSIPFIERINKRGSDRMFTDTDFYSSLSGELASTSATTTYMAKIENGDFTSYVFSGNVWTVTDKMGTVYKFGSSTASRQDHPNNTATTSKWMLQEMKDRNGNYVTYTYTKSDGQIYPATITYTHSSSTTGIFELEFNRETRSHATSSSVEFPVVTKYRIAQIVAKVNGSWVRKYELDYTNPEYRTRDLLSSVTEYGRADD